MENKKGQVEVTHAILLVILGIIVIAALIFVFGSMYIIQPGERGLIVTLGSLDETVYQPGFHFKWPLVQRVVKMNVQTQTISFDNKQGTGDTSEYSSLFAASKDLQDVQVAVVVNFHINEKDVPYIYKQYGTSETYLRNIVEPMIRETVKGTASLYTAEELVTKRTLYSEDVAKKLDGRMTDKQAVFERFNVVNFQFSKSFTDAIEAKVTAEQNALQAKNKLEQIKFEAEQRIATAEAEAKAIQIQTAAINSQGGDAYVKMKSIEKWDGHYPQVMGNSVNPILDMREVIAPTVAATTTK